MHVELTLLVGWLVAPAVTYAAARIVVGWHVRRSRRVAPVDAQHRLEQLRAERARLGRVGGRMSEALRLAEGPTAVPLRINRP